MGEDGMQVLQIPYSLTVRELGVLTNSSAITVIKKLMANGVMASINQQIDFETAAVVASELGFEPELEHSEEVVEELGEMPLWRKLIADEAPALLQERAPVVTILGHVDHGKTTLLDAIRHSNVASGEAGGITQHIGAYQVMHKDQLITFLDTPGHAAFSAMRARGAQGADIVVLVVASDDGVKPQTKEAANHAKAAKVPIIVALNKIDKSGSNPELAKTQLSEIGLVPDDWEGDTIVVPVSAKNQTGLDDLMEAILLVADTRSIKANPKGQCIGTVVEANLDKSTGPMATLLVQNGTLKVGDVVISGESHGKIKAMFDQRGKRVTKAGPSTPVVVMGLGTLPDAGDLFQVVENEKAARSIVAERKQEREDKRSTKRVTLEEMFAKYKSGLAKELRLILKADVQGSLEPIINELSNLEKSDKELTINVLHAETGNISESDVMLAAASEAIVIGFAVTADAASRRLAETEGVSIRLYDIIYRLIEDIDKALQGLLEPEIVEKIVGKAKVLAVFQVSKQGNAAGMKVVSGELRRNAKVRVLRDGEVIHTGDMAALKREKDDVKEVREGMECGMSLKNFTDFQVGDEIECYIEEKFGG